MEQRRSLVAAASVDVSSLAVWPQVFYDNFTFFLHKDFEDRAGVWTPHPPAVVVVAAALIAAAVVVAAAALIVAVVVVAAAALIVAVVVVAAAALIAAVVDVGGFVSAGWSGVVDVAADVVVGDRSPTDGLFSRYPRS